MWKRIPLGIRIALGGLMTFVSTSVMFRLCDDWLEHGNWIHAESWTSPVDWGKASVLALICLYAYVYRNRENWKQEIEKRKRNLGQVGKS